jgi:hypothetical protein
VVEKLNNSGQKADLKIIGKGPEKENIDNTLVIMII